ncbi:MAG TPA: efflux RND transporter periplasmic adaptor subunit [Polyangiaceae bacterium]
MACLGAVALLLGGCKRDSAARAEQGATRPGRQEVKEVRLVPASELGIERTVSISGTLDADERVTLSAKVPGRLASISVDMASTVQEGQALAELERVDYQLKVEQAAAALAQVRAELGIPPEAKDDDVDVENTALVRQARATHDEAQAHLARARALVKEGLMTAMELDTAEAAAVRAETGLQSAREQVGLRRAGIRQRRSELRLAQQQMADTVIRSPIDGVVQLRHVSAGSYLAAGAPVLEIVRINPLRLRVAIPEREAASVRAGQLVRVQLEGDGAAHTGKVARLAPAIERQSRSLLVEADIENPGTLRPGSFVNAHIVIGTTPALSVPASAVVQFAGLHKVLTVTGGKAVEKRVTLGKRAGDRVEIESGLKKGELVVVRPGSLQHGQPVRTVPGS